jgi:hypothetical protein
MKNKLVLLLFLACLAGNAIAQTVVTGGAVQGNWTKANSPYIIQNAIMVANSTTLTIDPGVRVEFQGHYKFLVMGQLKAVGTPADTIVFTAANASTGWFGIRFENTPSSNDTTRISYCKIEYGKANGTNPLDCGGAFYFDHFSKTKISNSLISHCFATMNGGAISCGYSSPVITNNKILSNSVMYGNGGGIYCENLSSPIITGNVITLNTASGNGGGIANGSDCNSFIANNMISSNTVSGIGGNGGGGIINVANTATITGNTIIYNSVPNTTGGGITDVVSGVNPVGGIISNNVIANNNALSGGGLYCYGDALLVINNVISNNSATNLGGGMMCENGCQAPITNNTIVNNTAANGGGMAFRVNASPTIKNCIIWGNTETADGPQVFLDDESSDPDFKYCDIMNGISAIGVNANVFYLGNYNNNINNNPFFVSPAAGSGTGYSAWANAWSLQASSPCIDNGDPVGPYSATDVVGNQRVVGSQIDIGAFESSIINVIRNENKNETASVFPNPLSSHAVVLLNGYQPGCTLGVVDLLGREVETKGIDGKQLIIEKGTKQSGIYFITINDSQGQLLFRKKIVIL